DQAAVTGGVQVGGVAGDLQLAGDARVGRVREVDRVEGVGLAEGDDVADVAEEPHRVDRLAPAQARHGADRLELAVAGGEHDDLALGGRQVVVDDHVAAGPRRAGGRQIGRAHV